MGEEENRYIGIVQGKLLQITLSDKSILLLSMHQIIF